MRILLADDESAIRTICRINLESDELNRESDELNRELADPE